LRVVSSSPQCEHAGVTFTVSPHASWTSSTGGPPGAAQRSPLGDAVGGMLLTGIGVGLAFPTLFATAAAALPPARFATGSAVVNMARQSGFAVGVAVFVAVVGTPSTPAARLVGFRHGWLVIAGTALAAGLAALALEARRPAVALAPVET
jgi:hypothetical protein